MQTEILMSTFNGAPWLETMLRSLLAQERDAFALRVRDDGSCDATWEMLNDMAPAFGGRMLLDPDRSRSGSAKASFARLLDRSEGETVLFADQDDEWTPDHVGVLSGLIEGERPDLPVFAFTDLVPVDKDLRPIAESFFAWKKTPPKVVGDLPQFLLANPICGCAAAANRACIKLGASMPVNDVAMHDWWLALLAAAAGKVVWSDRATVRYRQHGGNASAQRGGGMVEQARGGARARMRRGLVVKARQANAVADRLLEKGVMGHPGAESALRSLHHTLSRGAVGRRLGLARGRYIYPDPGRAAAQMVFC